MRNFARRVAAAALAGALALGLAACTPGPTGPPVVVLFPGTPDDVWGSSAAVLRSELEGDGYAVEVRYAGDDIPSQLLQLREALEARPTAIVVAPIEATALAAELARSDDPDVAVISYDRLIFDAPEVDYYATFDHAATGRMLAQHLVDGLRLDERDPRLGPARIELLAGSGDNPAAQATFAGALEVVQPLLDARAIVAPSGRVTFEQAAVLRGAPETAAARLEALLAEGFRLDAVFSPDDRMSAAAAEVLTAQGYQIVSAPDAADPEATDPEATDPDATPTPDADPTPEPPAASEVPTDDPTTDPRIPDPTRTRDNPRLVLLTGAGTTRAGARALLADAQTVAVYEDPRALARIVADMVREVVQGRESTLTAGAVTFNGARDIPTLLLEPQLLDREGAARLAGS